MANQFAPIEAHAGLSLDQLHTMAQSWIGRCASIPMGQGYGPAVARFHKARQSEADPVAVSNELRAIVDASPDAVRAMVKAGAVTVEK